MHPRTLFTAAAVALVMLVSQPAHAQGEYDFKVPFDFVANGQTLKAGAYYLVPNSEDTMLTLRSRDVKGAAAVVLLVTTRLAENKSLTDPTVVFDKVDGKLYVSELTVPGNDGYLFLATKAKHSHELVKGAKVKG
jgi:hypothetical protein